MRGHSTAAVLAALVVLLAPIFAQAAQHRDALLDQGLRTDEPYSVSLWKKSLSASRVEKRRLLDEALSHSPDLPGLYFKRAWASLPDIVAAVDFITEGAKAYSRNFWWSFGLKGLLYVSMLVSLLAALFITAAVLFFRDAPILAHDIRESRRRLSALALPLLFSPLGPVGFVVGLMMATGVFLRKWQKAAVYFSIAAVFLTPAALKQVDYYLSAETAALGAIVSVNEGKAGGYALESFKGGSSFESRFSYAAALKKAGRYEEAISVLDELKESNDQRVYTNLGNAYFAAGDKEKAKEHYKKAVELGASVVTYYNLSQILRDEFNYREGDAFYEKAMSIDRDKVSGFTAMATKNPNRFVIDTTLGPQDFEAFARRNMKGVFHMSPFGTPLYYGAATVALVLFIVMDRISKDRAFRCSNCSRVVCPRCSGSRHLCPECLASERRPDDTSPKAKVAKMLTSLEHKRKLQNRTRALSFTLPGVAHIYAGRPVAGLLMLWPFLFMAACMALNPFLKVGMAGFTHEWIYLPAALGCVLVWVQSVLTVSRRLEVGWL